LVEARNKKPEVIVKKEGGFVPRLVVVFNIGKSNISKREYMNIEAMAKGIKANPDKTFTVTGYADKGTGSAEYNQKLSEKRAETVANELVKMGVNRDNIITEAKGGVMNLSPFSYNRRATVQVGE
jgi:outer membrane protein OmpA-like peptidoglycan-associated protein